MLNRLRLERRKCLLFYSRPFKLQAGLENNQKCLSHSQIGQFGCRPYPQRHLSEQQGRAGKEKWLALLPWGSSPRFDSISKGGIGARGRGLQSLAVGDLVALELYIPVLAHALSVNSLVRYIHGRRKTGRCGLQFQSLTEDQGDVITRYCRMLPQKNGWRWPRFWSIQAF